jgi:LL-diaminopimelate aminotransferase
MQTFALQLASEEYYTGYGPEQGMMSLRTALAENYYRGMIDPQEIFVSDGSKCDVGRLQILFGSQTTMAVQDPSYPAYVDTGVINGQTSSFLPLKQQYQGITYLPCSPENNFFPNLTNLPRTDLIYFCSPNNPTGTAATYEQLKELVQFAKRNQSIIIFDAAYASFVRNVNVPQSIYEIEGAKEVAIELGSFSKMIGFTGVRLGWSVVPKELCFEDGHSIQKDWNRVICTFFNGASNIVQAGGLAALQESGLQAMRELSAYYMENSDILKKIFKESGCRVFGGENVPYLWVHFPGLSSWNAFEILLEESQILSVPGSGFGPSGEGFLRFSAFCKRSDILSALPRIQEALSRLN